VAAKTGDLMVIMGATIAVVILIAVVNLITDVCYALLNPQVRVT
jgi:ABC-type dipeptide/oligopeptide/nickel transport system permease component